MSKEKKEKAPKVKKEKTPKAKKIKEARPAVPARKVPTDVYTLVLFLSFLFFVGAVALLYLDLASYK